MRFSATAVATTLLASQLVASAVLPVEQRGLAAIEDVPSKRTTESTSSTTGKKATTSSKSKTSTKKTPTKTSDKTATKSSDAASFDKPLCYWLSEDSLYVAFAVLVPEGSSSKMEKALKGSSACSGYSQYKSKMVGPGDKVFGAGFIASDFCTAYDMTNVLKNAFGKQIGCNKWTGKVDGAPGPDALLAELPEADKRSIDVPASPFEFAQNSFDAIDWNGEMPVRPTATAMPTTQ